MRIDKNIEAKHVAERRQERTERITRIIALIVAFLSVFGFFVKLVFL